MLVIGHSYVVYGNSPAADWYLDDGENRAMAPTINAHQWTEFIKTKLGCTVDLDGGVHFERNYSPDYDFASKWNIQDNYDYIIIDCPPALGLLSLNALAAADSVIIPVQSEYLALHGVRQLLDTIEQVKSVFNPVLRVMGVLICLHDIRKKLARAVSDTIRTYFGDLVFETVIKTNVALAEAPSDGKTIFEYAPRERGADDYRELANEIESGKF